MKRQIKHIALFALLYSLCAGCGGGSTQSAGSRMADVYGDDYDNTDEYYESYHSEEEEEDEEEVGIVNVSRVTRNDAMKITIGDDAWISMSPKATAYHIYEDCEALVRTVYAIEYVTIDEAICMGRHLCGYCEERLECELMGEEYEHEW